jgi:D-sedoheptulose 7-phosphate isomerase
MTFSEEFLAHFRQVIDELQVEPIENVVNVLFDVRDRGGRLFLIGSGGGAGHASHATSDFRKLCGFEAYCPSDNVSELTARINDEGWDTSLVGCLKASRLRSQDCVFVFSVGGGNERSGISVNLVRAANYAKSVRARVVGIIGRDGGCAAQLADACIIVPTADPALVTPHTEGMQAVLWHLIVSHPRLQKHSAKWESRQ